MVCGLLTGRVGFSLVVACRLQSLQAPEHVGSVVRHAGSLVVARVLSSYGVPA